MSAAASYQSSKRLGLGLGPAGRVRRKFLWDADS